MGLAISASLRLEEVLRVVCQEALIHFGVTTALIWRLKGSDLECLSALGLGADVCLGMVHPVNDDGIGAQVLRQSRPMYFNYAKSSNDVKPALLRVANARSLMGVPFFRGSTPIGSMVLLDSKREAPFGPEDVDRARVFAQHAALAIHNAQLYEETRRQASELARSVVQLEATYRATLGALSSALDARDRETDGHSRRVTAYTMELARALDYPARAMPALERGALLHDIGKIGIPDAILRKPGPLTDSEWEVMRGHPAMGAQMLKDIDFLADAVEIVLTHQERFNGSGYPGHLKGTDIPLGSRVFAVADAFDAMTSERPYRTACGFETAVREIELGAGTHFDPTVVNAFQAISPTRWQLLRDIA